MGPRGPSGVGHALHWQGWAGLHSVPEPGDAGRLGGQGQGIPQRSTWRRDTLQCPQRTTAACSAVVAAGCREARPSHAPPAPLPAPLARGTHTCTLRMYCRLQSGSNTRLAKRSTVRSSISSLPCGGWAGRWSAAGAAGLAVHTNCQQGPVAGARLSSSRPLRTPPRATRSSSAQGRTGTFRRQRQRRRSMEALQQGAAACRPPGSGRCGRFGPPAGAGTARLTAGGRSRSRAQTASPQSCASSRCCRQGCGRCRGCQVASEQ